MALASGADGSSRGAGPLLGGECLSLPDVGAVRQAVLRRLRRAITVQEMPAGTRLLQTHLAAQLGVSRMPVRDAISDLVAEGLATPLSGGGAVVTELSLGDMRAVYEIRAILELKAVRIVTEMGSGQLVADLRALIEQAKPLIFDGQREGLVELDREFHWAIYRATGNRFLQMALAPMWLQVDRIMYAILLLPSYMGTAWREHEEITVAIAEGDVGKAVALTQNHLENAADRLISDGNTP